MREFTLESDRYVDRAATLHGLHRTDLNALGFLVRPSREATTMTPGKLGEALNLSSPATTASMTEHARNVGRALFMPLAVQLGGSLEHYTPAELAVVQRFLLEMTEATTTATENLQAPE